MIVIAIIGVLAAALFPSLTAYLKRSRDAGRTANLNTINTAMGAYFSDKEAYPGAVASASGCINGTDVAGTNYFPKGLPQDPVNNNSPCNFSTSSKWNYGYGTIGTTNAATGYVISGLMENSNWGNYTIANWTITGSAVDSASRANAIAKGTGAYMIMTN